MESIHGVSFLRSRRYIPCKSGIYTDTNASIPSCEGLRWFLQIIHGYKN